MRMIPGMTVIVPADGNEARKATFALAQMEGPAYLRTARLASPVFEQDYPFEIGKANVLREGKDAAVFACGLMVNETLEAAKLLAAEGIGNPVRHHQNHVPILEAHFIFLRLYLLEDARRQSHRTQRDDAVSPPDKRCHRA